MALFRVYVDFMHAMFDFWRRIKINFAGGYTVFNIRINPVPTRFPIWLRRGGEELLDLILGYVTLAVVDSIKEICLQWIGRD